MKKSWLILLLLTLAIYGCCGSQKTTTDSKETNLYDQFWELEYLSGTKIAFEGLYPEKKPGIQLNKANGYFGGNTGCNGFSGKYQIINHTIKLEALTKTMAFCEGGGEEAFLNMVDKVNRFAIDSDGKLLLMIDDIPMMRFKKPKN